MAALDAVLSFGTCAGLLCMFLAFLIAIGNDRYTEQTCAAVISIGFIVTVLCGLPLLVLRNLTP